jgi:drug/metabolite transporter (DMT)-like permease
LRAIFARAGIFTNLTPLFGALFAIPLLGEPFRLYHGAAMAPGLAGLAVARSAPTPRTQAHEPS